MQGIVARIVLFETQQTTPPWRVKLGASVPAHTKWLERVENSPLHLAGAESMWSNERELLAAASNMAPMEDSISLSGQNELLCSMSRKLGGINRCEINNLKEYSL